MSIANEFAMEVDIEIQEVMPTVTKGSVVYELKLQIYVDKPEEALAPLADNVFMSETSGKLYKMEELMFLH
eukprot:6471963-Amphidinium_carterae.1